jgi:prepilin-type N-terminal cleavage/methylation domain-containing protein/prepilin-type processing-associated H-X9-DG protein
MKNHDSKNTSSGIRPGFTLTELLVVIVIIVVIASLAMVGMSRVRDMADKASAIRSLSQLQIANASFATDNGGRYVSYQVMDVNGKRAGWWYQVPQFLNHFRGEVYMADGSPDRTVPLSMLDPKVVRAKADNFHKSMAGSFGMNNTGLPNVVNIPNGESYYTTASVTQPERSMAFASATDVRVAYGARFNWKGVERKTSDGAIAYRHGNKAIVVYFDGHVGEMSKGDLEAIDKRGGSNNVFWRPKQ